MERSDAELCDVANAICAKRDHSSLYLRAMGVFVSPLAWAEEADRAERVAV